jgi:hypothetical protein
MISRPVETAPVKEAAPIKEEISSPSARVAPKVNARNLAGKVVFAIGMLALLGLAALSVLSRTSSPELHSRIRPTLRKMIDRVPVLRPAFKMVPGLADVRAEDLLDLESAVQNSPESGVKAGLALSLNDANRPYFYVSTNLPDRTKLEIYLVGNSETLLNRLQFTSQAIVTTSNGIAKSDVFLMEGGQPIPKGEYMVYLYEAADQEESVKKSLVNYASNRGQSPLPTEVPQTVRYFFSKKYFLGGERDETYLTRLKAFHESIKQKADREIAELRQYSETLILQHNSLTSGFQKLLKAKKITPGMKANWKRDSTTWMQISGQLDQTIQTWSKETLQNEFFYGKTYDLVKSAFQSMRSLIQLESDFIDKNQDRNAFEIAHGKLLSETRDSLELLKQKMDLLMRTPKTPSGLPMREGL